MVLATASTAVNTSPTSTTPRCRDRLRPASVADGIGYIPHSMGSGADEERHRLEDGPSLMATARRGPFSTWVRRGIYGILTAWWGGQGSCRAPRSGIVCGT